jgi:hypothetical protein
MSRLPASVPAQPRPKTRLKQAFQRSLDTLSAEEARRLADRYVHIASAQIEQAGDAPSGEGISLPGRLGISTPSAAETMLLLIENNRRLAAERQVMRQQSLSTTALAQRFGRSKQWVHERLQAGKFLAYKDGDRLYFPEWQLDPTTPDGVISGLPEVWAALSLSSFAKLYWLTHTNRYLDSRSPLEALRAGDLAQVLAEAQAVGKMS